jgi:hypothetical protein
MQNNKITKTQYFTICSLSDQVGLTEDELNYTLNEYAKASLEDLDSMNINYSDAEEVIYKLETAL